MCGRGAWLALLHYNWRVCAPVNRQWGLALRARLGRATLHPMAMMRSIQAAFLLDVIIGQDWGDLLLYCGPQAGTGLQMGTVRPYCYLCPYGPDCNVCLLGLCCPVPPYGAYCYVSPWGHIAILCLSLGVYCYLCLF